MTSSAALPYVCQATDTHADEWKSCDALEVQGTFDRMKDRRHFRHTTGLYAVAELYAYGGRYHVQIEQVKALELNA